MRTLAVALLLVLAGLQARLWFGDGGVRDVWALERAVSTQEAENERLRTRNRALLADVQDLRVGLAAVEERARSELGMVGRDETFYQVVDTRSTE